MRKITLHVLAVGLAVLISGQVNAQDLIDLTAVDNPETILADTLPDLNSGSIVLLKPGVTYNADGYAFDKSFTLQNSKPSNLNRPKIYCGSNFNFADGATVDSIIFRNLEFLGEYEARYVLNADKSATVGKMMFEGCYIHDLRGITRMKGGTGTLDEYIFDNCMITMIRDYGLLTVDQTTWAVNNIMLANTTVTKTRAFMTSKNNTETLVIDGCTFSETPETGGTMFRWRETGQDNITGGIMVKNTLWGTGWDEDGVDSTNIVGYDGLESTTWTFENTYATSDLSFVTGSNAITGFNYTYADLSTALWNNVAAGSLHYADTTFDGIGNAGDQRWAIATEDGSEEWNISAAAYKNLGTLDLTQKVAGLTIYANSSKTITIDANNKTVDGMSFTDRLKLGGSGDFDDDGQPLGRVVSIDVTGGTNITVAAMSSSSSEDRTLNIAAGHEDSIIAAFPALGASLTLGEYMYEGEATKLYFYSPSSGVNIYYIKAGHIANTNSSLSDLTVSAGTLVPAFDPAVTDYTVEAPNGTTSVTVGATPEDSYASVTGTGPVNVSSGSGTATITVTAEDGVSTNTYTIAITVEAGGGEEPDLIDLTTFDDADILADTIPNIPDGSTVILKPGMIYNAGGIAFGKSVTIESSQPSNLNRPKIYLAANYNFANFGTIDSVIFRNLEFYYDDFNDKYILNANVSATVGKLMLEGCYIHDLRGVVRMKDAGPGTLDEFVMDNCVVTMIRDYGVLTVDYNTWAVNNILVRNSTISKTRTFMTSKNNTETLVIDGCTFNDVTSTGQRMFRWREAGQDNVTGGITVKNTIWSHGWDEDGVDSTNIDGYDGLEATIWTFENTYATSDLVFVTGEDAITGFNYTYDGLSSDLWRNDTAGNFCFADTTFAGLGNAGDQRWAIATETGEMVWNISGRAYMSLGTLDATQQVAGLTIYANSAKTVTIDANNKTVGDMEFTNRLKLGGSGDFDADGQPLGRVLSVDVSGNTGITVAAMSSSSSSDRILNIAAGHEDSIIAEFDAMGASLTMGSYVYEGGATKLYFYSPSSGVNVYYISTGHIAGTDATLSGLTVSSGTLTPDFDPAVTGYTVEVPAGTLTVSVGATVNDPNASLEGAGDVDVSGGTGTATITVTAEDGTTQVVYTVDITVALNNDALLSNLTVSDGILNPFFDQATTSYSVILPLGTTNVTVTATANDPNATITGDGDIDVSSGSETATIVVTAEDGTTTETYTIDFTVITGIEDAAQRHVSVYPTVSYNYYFNVDFAGTPGKITVYDLSGRPVLIRNASSNIEKIYLEHPGMYLFKIETENEISTARVIRLR